MKNFKYKATFNHEINPESLVAKDQWNLQDGDLNFSEASSKKLKKLLPYVNFDRNIDLIGICFEAAIVNVFNSNHDGISSATAMDLIDKFINKFINVEHDRDNIIGHISRADFIERTFGNYLFYDDIIDTDEPFSIGLGGIIYKLADKSLTAALEQTSEGEKFHKKIYASWELGFSKYHIGVTNGSMLIKDAEIITDPIEIEAISPKLKCFGGKGKDGKKHLFRIPIGEVYPLGVGLTMSPAAKVDPIYVNGEEKEEPEVYSETPEAVYAMVAHDEKITKLMTESSKTEKKRVKDGEDTDFTSKIGDTMTKEEIQKLVQESVASALAEKSSKKITDEDVQQAVANATEKIIETMIEKNDEYLDAKKAKEEAEAKQQETIANAEKSAEELKKVQDELAQANEKFEGVQKELDALKAEKEQVEATASFNARMETIDNEYELTDEDREIIGKRVADIKSDEDFEAYSAELSVLLKEKSKAEIARKAEEAKAAAEGAGEGEGEGKELEGGEEEGKKVTNNSAEGSSQEKSLPEKFKDAFGGKMKISA